LLVQLAGLGLQHLVHAGSYHPARETGSFQNRAHGGAVDVDLSGDVYYPVSRLVASSDLLHNIGRHDVVRSMGLRAREWIK
jgi:hypothetical protein